MYNEQRIDIIKTFHILVRLSCLSIATPVCQNLQTSLTALQQVILRFMPIDQAVDGATVENQQAV